MKLWHDDIRTPPDGWEWARTNAQAMVFLEQGEVDEISLDHDLGYHDVSLPEDPDDLAEVLILKGQGEETGMDLVRWMVETKRVPPKVTIHSWNPPGAANMRSWLEQHGYECVVAPYVIG